MSNQSNRTVLQQRLSTDWQTILDLVKLLAPKDHTFTKLAVSRPHTWVNIDAGNFRLCINNHESPNYGKHVTREDFVNKPPKFRLWVLFYSVGEITPELEQQAIALLIERGYELPSVDELWEHYWSKD